MVHLIYHNRKTGLTNHWSYVFASDANETCKVLEGDLKYVVRNEQDLHQLELPTLLLRDLYFESTGKNIRWNNRKSVERKVYAAMAKLTKEEVKNLPKTAPAVAPTPGQVANQIAAENETAEQKEAREKAAAEKAEADRLAAEKKAADKKEKDEAPAKKKPERAEAAERRKADVEARKARREQEKATRLAARANGPVDCPHNAKIKFLKTKEEFPTFKGNRDTIVKQLQDGQTVGEFIKAASKAVPGAGVGDVRIYIEKGMIQLEKPEPTPEAQKTDAPTPTPEAPAQDNASV